jgi:hypothetical protein
MACPEAQIAKQSSSSSRLVMTLFSLWGKQADHNYNTLSQFRKT